MHTDLNIHGRGFYTISAESPRGRSFMRRVDGNDHGTAYSDDTRMTQDIADGAHTAGLRVFVNGRRYLGNNRVE
jgi:hypothetical protein